MFPSMCAGIGPVAGTASPYFWCSFIRTYACSERYSGRSWPHRRSSSAVNASGGMSYFARHIAPVSANPSSFAPVFDSSTKRV